MGYRKDMLTEEAYIRFPYDVRWAKKEDWKPAMLMVWETFLKFEGKEYSPEGVNHFYEFISDDDLYRAFLNGNYPMLLAVDRERIIGVATVRGGNMLSLLFVDEAYQRQKVGQILLELFCRHLKQVDKEMFITVKAAPSAVPFYERCGFVAARPEEDYAGIRVVRMLRDL